MTPSRIPHLPPRAGIGLRAPHHEALIEERPAVAFVEVHSENYFGGGRARESLRRARERYPLSLHGVGLSLGSVDPLSARHLARLAELIDEFEPALVSEHLSWSSFGGVFANDLLPLPYTEEALAHMAARVGEAQERLGRRILIENPSSYLEFAQSAMPEWEFLAELARRSGCGILLDVNNLYVSARNHGFDAQRYLRALPAEAIGEIHLAGFSVNRFEDGELLIDTHSRPVAEEVWALYAVTVARLGPRPTLIEWDADIPPLGVLVAEAHEADALLEACDVRAA
jgi:hypothetical protein